MIQASVIERFESLYFPEPMSGCWLWTGKLNTTGYGRMWNGGVELVAHRLSYSIHHGPIPEGLMVCHRCDVRCCVNPDHLYAGTAQDNTNDMGRRNRHHRWNGARRGAGNPHSVLTHREAMASRILMESGVSPSLLARCFGVGSRAMWAIKTGRSWKS